MKILIIQTAFIGDVILATPIIEKLHRFFPEAQIDFLLRKGNERLLEDHPLLQEVHVWDKKKGKLRDGWRILKNLRSQQYDLVINCQRFLSSGIFTLFSGAASTVGFDKNPLSIFFSKKVKHQFGTEEKPVHEVDRNLALITHLTNIDFEKPRLYPSKNDSEHAANLVKQQGGRPYVCMAPTSVWFTKQWPEKKWAELIHLIPADHTIFLLGGKDDFIACEHIAKSAGHAQSVNLSGKLTFLQSAALMAGAKMNFVNDSAPMHMASAMNAPVTAIFCSTIPMFGFTPLSEISFIVENQQPLACRPCGLHGYKACPQGHFKCAYDISSDQFLTII